MGRTVSKIGVLLLTSLCVLTWAGKGSQASLKVPSYQPPQFSAPLQDVYVWIAGISIDFSTNAGRVVLNVHPDSDAADKNKPPLDQIGVSFGDVLVPEDTTKTPKVPAVKFLTLAELSKAAADQQKADTSLDPMSAVRAAIYNSVKGHPRLKGATDVP